MNQYLVTESDVECLVGEGELADIARLKIDIFEAGNFSDSSSSWRNVGTEVDTINMAVGDELGELTVMVPEPALTSKSIKWGLESSLGCNLGNKLAALFSVVRTSWRIAPPGG